MSFVGSMTRPITLWDFLSAYSSKNNEHGWIEEGDITTYDYEVCEDGECLNMLELETSSLILRFYEPWVAAKLTSDGKPDDKFHAEMVKKLLFRGFACSDLLRRIDPRLSGSRFLVCTRFLTIGGKKCLDIHGAGLQFDEGCCLLLFPSRPHENTFLSELWEKHKELKEERDDVLIAVDEPAGYCILDTKTDLRAYGLSSSIPRIDYPEFQFRLQEFFRQQHPLCFTWEAVTGSKVIYRDAWVIDEWGLEVAPTYLVPDSRSYQDAEVTEKIWRDLEIGDMILTCDIQLDGRVRLYCEVVGGKYPNTLQECKRSLIGDSIKDALSNLKLLFRQKIKELAWELVDEED